MSNENLTQLTVSQLGQHIQRRDISPVEVAEAYICRIDALEPQLNAFITRLDEHALREAREAQKEILGGNYRGPFHGIPVGLKDLFWTKDIRTTSGSLIDSEFVPTADSAVASQMKVAGAYCIGKLHMTEFAFDGTSLNRYYGPARNPWDLARMAGGSSSGPGAAVASGQVPIAMGTDTGGSVRVPAALCGITGLKPTFGLISRYGVTPLSWSMDHVGPMTRTVRDAALALNMLAGYDSRDPDSVQIAPQDYLEELGRDIRRIRIGIPQDFIWEVVAPEVEEAFRGATVQLESLGSLIRETSFPDMGLINAAGSVVQTSEAATIHRSRVLALGQHFDPAIRRRIESGLFIPAEAYLHAQQVRAKLKEGLLKAMEDADLLATPTTAIAAPEIGQERATMQGQDVPIREALLRITRVFSTVGLPAISVPCGFTKGGLPVGLQLVGKPFSESLLLRAAHAYQESTDWHLRRPEV
ncbi:MAG: amidase [Dehalococcoidia bacterium]|nr:amidase [Dehalococcoidia bacterium]